MLENLEQASPEQGPTGKLEMALVLHTCPDSTPMTTSIVMGCQPKGTRPLHLGLFRTGLQERICGDISAVAVSRREVDPRIDQTFASVILKRVVQYVSLGRTLPKVHTLAKGQSQRHNKCFLFGISQTWMTSMLMILMISILTPCSPRQNSQHS